MKGPGRHKTEPPESVSQRIREISLLFIDFPVKIRKLKNIYNYINSLARFFVCIISSLDRTLCVNQSGSRTADTAI